MNVYRFGLLNIYPYNLPSCECSDAFMSCLEKVRDDEGQKEEEKALAEEVMRLFYEALEMK